MLQDPEAAVALVNAKPEKLHNSPASAKTSSLSPTSSGIPSFEKDTGRKNEDKDDADPDLARAKDLVRLHYAVKVAATNGDIQSELAAMRQNVRDAVGSIV